MERNSKILAFDLKNSALSEMARAPQRSPQRTVGEVGMLDRESRGAGNMSSEFDNVVTLGGSLMSLCLPSPTSHICQRRVITRPHLMWGLRIN